MECAAPQPGDHASRRGGRAVESTALEMRHTRKGIGGSNPPLSASQSAQSAALRHSLHEPRSSAAFRAYDFSVVRFRPQCSATSSRFLSGRCSQYGMGFGFETK